VTLAVAWVASNPLISAPILSARRPEQLDASLAGAELAADGALMARLTAIGSSLAIPMVG
jgi:aryl-alcohol dehydrogenase-like predicted oxidoreductase